jgi:tetratricopeptide (TPR) repeat protein
MNHIAYYLRDVYLNKKSGRLIFKHGSIQKYLFFQEGNLVFARSNQPSEQLGGILVKLGRISEVEKLRIDYYIEPRKNIGQILVKKGLISERDLYDGLVYQMKEITLNVFPYFDAEILFQEQEQFMEQGFESKIGVPFLIEDGIRRMKFHPSLKEFMGKKILSIRGKTNLHLLTEEEREIFSRIKEKLSTEVLQASMRVNPDIFWKSLYLFYCLDLIDFEGEEPVSRKEPKEEPPSEKIKDQIADVLALRENLSSLNYYQALNVAKDASEGEIKKAYFNLARKYHPDRFDRNLPASIRNQVEEVFDYITKAYRTLADAEKRIEYNSRVSISGKEEEVNLSKKAEIKFRQGKTLFNQGKYEDALTHLEEAVRLRPNKGDYYLMLGMTESRIPFYRKKAEKDFLKAIELEPWNPEGFVGLGLLYKQEGLLTKARRHLEKALEVDSEHEMASKELDEMEGIKKKKGLKDLLQMDVFGSKKKKK